MSYSRQYHEVVHGSKTVSYPASQDGGTTTVSVSIPVSIHIHVDTNPFDSSVRHAEKNITLLTGAVVATETATILAKRKNAKKVGDTIVGGFFSYVQSEISQQISEITQQTEALLMHIKGLAESCLNKKDQMMADYKRITGRYLKTFTDLNRELTTRIHQLDEPAFLFRELTNELHTREKGSGAISTIMVFNAENTDVQVKLSSALAKKQAALALQKISSFLAQQKKSDDAIRHCMQNDNRAQSRYLPVCISVTRSSASLTDKQIFAPEAMADLTKTMASQNSNWVPLKSENLQQLNFYFNKAISQNAPEERVVKMIRQIAQLQNLQTL